MSDQTLKEGWPPPLPATAEASAVSLGSSGAARGYTRLALWMAITDALALEAAIILSRLLRYGVRPVGKAFIVLMLAAPVVWVLWLLVFHVYDIPRLSPAEEFRRLLEATAAATVLGLLMSLYFRSGRSSASPGGWIAFTWAITLILLLVGRKGWHRRMWRLRARGELLYRTLIVGANKEAIQLAEALRDPALGFRPIGLVRTELGWTAWDGLPVVGSVYQLSDLVEALDAECVFVASSSVEPDEMRRITKQLRRRNVEMRVSANMAEILTSRLSVQQVGDLLALSLRPVRLSGAQAAVKRTFDLAAGIAATILSAPLWLVTGAAIKANSRGPVLFRQERVGRNGRSFTMYKFRTMVHGAEQLLAQLEDRNEASGPLFKIRDDPRVTRVGKWLRKWSLDELPQLVNVLKGEMSLVGPRPALPREVATYEDWHRDRLEVKPGITGLWQVGGRSELGFDDYVKLDLFYIENWSLTYDLYILAKTVPSVLMPRGAY